MGLLGEVMEKAKQYNSEAFAAIHQTMDALHKVGAINTKTMRDFDETCIETVEELTPKAIQELRKREHVSQPIFAMYLNVSKNLISDWERGVKKPGGPAIRLLNIVKKHGLSALV